MADQGTKESGKSTIFKQLKLLFQSGFDEAELRSYIPAICANVYQIIKILYDGSKEFARNDPDSMLYVLPTKKKDIGENLPQFGSRLDYPPLTEEVWEDIKNLWDDPVIQETFSRGNELQLPDCSHYFMESLQRFADPNYVPTTEDVLHARVRTTGVAQIQFSLVRGNKNSGDVYRIFNVGGQINERRKWIHLFDDVSAVIVCAAISEYDQTFLEEENKNRLIEAKKLFQWALKQSCFEKTTFVLFLNKFDVFENKVPKVPLNVCEWFKDYKPISSEKHEIEHAYEYVRKKFEEAYFETREGGCVDRVLKIYRTTALDQKLIKKTFKLVHESLTRINLLNAGLL